MTNVREIAYEALLTVEKGTRSNSLTKEILDKYSYLDKRDRSFLARLIEGTIERQITIDYVLDLYSKVKVRKMKPPVRILMRMGVYQLMYMDSVPESAAVNETVKIAKKHGLHNLTGFMNGVLRNIARNKVNIEFPTEDSDRIKYLSIKYSCPEWIVNRLVCEQGYENAKTVLDNSISVRNITGRVNISKCSAEEVIGRNGDNIVKSPVLPNAICLHNIDNINDIDDFIKGYFTIQDISSMLVCQLAGIEDTDIVIDVCAAPGGKSLHAADIATNGKVISCDISEDKISKIRENVDRCRFENIDTYIKDATVLENDFIDKADVVIADVPCSGLGVMGRKNDIKYNLDENQIDELCSLSRLILQNASQYVKVGGILMFSTCTVSKLENQGGYEYIRNELGLEPVSFYDDLPEQLQDDSAKEGYLQLYGKDGISDGFFISKFKRIR